MAHNVSFVAKIQNFIVWVCPLPDENLTTLVHVPAHRWRTMYLFAAEIQNFIVWVHPLPDENLTALVHLPAHRWRTLYLFAAEIQTL